MRTEVIIGMERIFYNLKKSVGVIIGCFVLGICLAVGMAVLSFNTESTEIIDNESDLKGANAYLNIKWNNLTNSSSTYETDVFIAENQIKEIVAIANGSKMFENINKSLEQAGYDKLGESDEISCNATTFEMIEVSVYSKGDAERLLFIENVLLDQVKNIIATNYVDAQSKVVMEPVVQNAISSTNGYVLVDGVYDENHIEVDEVTIFDSLISKQTILVVMASIIIAICYVVMKVFTDDKIYIKEDLQQFIELRYWGSLTGESIDTLTQLLNYNTSKNVVKNIALVNFGSEEFEMKNLKSSLDQNCKHVMINLIDYTDSDLIKIVSNSDASLLLVKKGVTSIKEFEEKISNLEILEGRIMGFVLVK